MRLIFRPSVLARLRIVMLHDVPPKFVTEYATLRQDIDGAISKWAADVRKGVFPRAENLYTVKPSTEIKEAA